jgi:EAL domain-containing protein (putative c-di-GMP-specific phosphodiesterase class I)
MSAFTLYANPLTPLKNRDLGGGYELMLTLRNLDTSIDALADSLAALRSEESRESLDRWVLGEAICTLRPAAELLARRRMSVTVNVSSHSLACNGFAGRLLMLLEQSGIPPELLTVQIDEVVALRHMSRCLTAVERLRAAGCGIGIDRFGLRKRSYLCLRKLPVTRVKLHADLVNGVTRAPRFDRSLRFVMEILRGLPVETVATHVDQPGVARRLRALGVDYAQGPIFGEPQALHVAVDALLRIERCNQRARMYRLR